MWFGETYGNHPSSILFAEMVPNRTSRKVNSATRRPFTTLVSTNDNLCNFIKPSGHFFYFTLSEFNLNCSRNNVVKVLIWDESDCNLLLVKSKLFGLPTYLGAKEANLLIWHKIKRMFGIIHFFLLKLKNKHLKAA